MDKRTCVAGREVRVLAVSAHRRQAQSRVKWMECNEGRSGASEFRQTLSACCRAPGSGGNEGGRTWSLPILSLPVLCLSLTACETVEVVELPPEPEPEPVVVSEPPVVEPPPPPEGAIIVRIPAGSRAELPAGAIGVIELTGEEAVRSLDANNETSSVTFEGLPVGTYDLSVTFDSGGVQVGSYSFPIEVDEGLGDITAPLNFLRGELVVQSVVRPALDRTYTGMATATPGDCIGVDASSPLRSDLNVIVREGRVELSMAMFEGGELQFTGRVDSLAEPFTAAGAFESSDGSTGNWEIAQLQAPTPRALAARIELDNPSGSCRSTLEFTGLVDPPAAVATRGSNRTMVVVSVTGQGSTRSETLQASETEVSFNDLLVGPYDISVEVMRGAQSFDTYNDSVDLDVDGATLTTQFDLDLALAEAEPMSSQADYGHISGAFEGKSVVLQDLHECVGSIALVDSTSLTATAGGAEAGETIQLTFDNFFGEVLELTGTVDGSDGALTASGTYESSASKSGTWSLGYLAMPSERQIALLVDFENETDACQATYEFSGMR